MVIKTRQVQQQENSYKSDDCVAYGISTDSINRSLNEICANKKRKQSNKYSEQIQIKP